MSNISRRAVTRGAAWSIPAISVAAGAPAVAASGCTAASMSAIDAAFTVASTNQGSLTINFYQAVQSANGYLGESWANLRNDSPYDLVYTAANPLVLRVGIVGLTGDDSERAGTRPSTSWGTIADNGYNPTTKTHTYTWTFTGTIPAASNGDNEADMWFHFQDGIDFGGRITNAVAVTPLQTAPPAAPTLASIALASGQSALCKSYYDSKVATYNQTAKNTTFYYDGSKNGGTANKFGDGSVAIGQTVRSDIIGDFRPAGAGDGIY